MPQYTVTLTSPDAAKARLRAALRLLGFDVVRIDETTAPAKPEAAPRKSKRLPESAEALAVAALFNRRPNTLWSKAEIAAFIDARDRQVITLPNMELIAKYYEAERRKGDTGKDCGRHRRDLGTFLNNIDGELDRARMAVTHKPRMAGKPYEFVPSNVVALPELTPEEREAGKRLLAEVHERKAL